MWNTNMSTLITFKKAFEAHFMHLKVTMHAKFSPSPVVWFFQNLRKILAFIVKEQVQNWNLLQ